MSAPTTTDGTGTQEATPTSSKAGKAGKAGKKASPRRYPTRGSTARGDGGQPGGATVPATTTVPPQDLERFFPGFEQILTTGISVALPEVIKLLGGSRSGTPDEQEVAASRDLSAMFGMLQPLMEECIPVLIDEVWKLTQQRSRDKEDPVLDDETIDRFFPVLIGALAPALINALPGAIKGISGLFRGSLTAEDEVEPVLDEEMITRFLGPLISVISPTIKKVLPQLISVVTKAADRDMGVGWQDFVQTNRLQDGDNVHLVDNSPIDDPNMTEIVIELAAHKTWWKGIQVQDGTNSVVDTIGVWDNNKIASVRVPSQVLVDPGGYLVFMKAKFMGVHTGMYRLSCAGLTQLRGHRAHFYWYAD